MQLHNNGPGLRSGSIIILSMIIAATIVIGLSPREVSAAPGGKSIPSFGYQAAFRDLYNGDYLDALKTFRREGRGAIKNAQTRWIDSICYHAMCGECYYQMGRYADALEHYDSAVKLYLAFSNWMTLVKFPATIRPAGVQRPAPWSFGERRIRLGHYPETMLIRQGEVLTEERLRQGGAIQQPVMFSIEVQEIVRCTTLAIRRRSELLGPLSAHDQLTGELLTALQRRPGLPNHWSEAWIDLQLGVAQLAAGKGAQAIKSLQRSTKAAGEYDHPLTAIALFELGRMAMKAGNWDAASKYLAEAANAAYYYPNATVLEDAFRLGALVHLAANRKGPFPPLPQAIRFAKTKGYRRLHASLLLSAAELAAADGQTRQAAAFLDQAQTAMARQDMTNGRMGTRLAYLQSLVFFQNGQTAEGGQALARAMNAMGNESLWLFQIGLVDRKFISGAATARLAMDLFADVLRDPGPADWALEPMESMAVLTHPHPLPLEHWFETAVARKEHERALEIADRCRRHRFFCTLPFGGRLESLRWIIEGPQEVLDPESRIHRQDILARHPAYVGLSKRAAQIRDELRRLPPVAEPKSDNAARQRKLFAELEKLSAEREAILRRIAVGREPAGLVFPPLHKTDKIQAALPEGHALLVFFSTSRNTYGFLFNKDRYSQWRLDSDRVLAKQLQKLLQDMGHYGAVRDVTMKELADDKWKKSAADLLDLILKGSKADFSKRFEELVIVPDGIFWYVPFEALQVRIGDKSEPLLSRVRIRYAPTASLAVPDGRPRKTIGATGVALGKLHPRSEDAAAQEAFDELAKSLPDTFALPEPPPASSSLYRLLFNSLVTFDEIDSSSAASPYAWSPLGIDRTRGVGSLHEWMDLPWGGPQNVILPGFHTAAENSLKGLKPSAAGDEVFLSACALMASGAKTAVLSRWPTGGRSSFEIVREFLQELPHTSPAEAWQRAALLTADLPLDTPAEPRIKQTLADAQAKAEHPFFWSGYLLIDSGVEPAKESLPGEKRAIEFKFKQPDDKGVEEK